MQKADGSRRVLTFVLWLFVFWLVVHYWDQAVGLIGVVLKALAPLIIGYAIAYVVNIIMVPMEGWIAPAFKSPQAKKALRPIALVLSFLFLIGAIAALTYLVIPKLIMCVEVLAGQISSATSFLMPYVGEWLNADFLNQPDMQSALKNGAKWLLTVAGGTLDSVVTSAGALLNSTVTVLIAVVLSVYLLSGKEKLLRQLAILMDVYLPRSFNVKARYIVNVTNNCFHRYIVGQCVEAVILGSLCALGMAVLQMPYAVMIGCVVGATALVPFVGAYIGAAIGAILILTVSPFQALMFLIYLVVLQQVESNLIYPHVVGSSIGLPGMWVLIAVAIGGSFGGILGIVLAVPLMATAYQLVKDGTAVRRAEYAREQAQGDGSAYSDCSEAAAGTLVGGASASVPASGVSASGAAGAGKAVEDAEDREDEEEGDPVGAADTIISGVLGMADALGSAIGLGKRKGKGDAPAKANAQDAPEGGAQGNGGAAAPKAEEAPAPAGDVAGDAAAAEVGKAASEEAGVDAAAEPGEAPAADAPKGE